MTSSRVARASGVLLIVLLWLSASMALAQEKAREDEYRKTIELGLSEFQVEHWAEARALFRRAHQLSPSARTFRGMALASFEMRDYVVAVEELEAALADTRQPLTDAQREECKELRDRAYGFVGRVTLVLTPREATVRFNNVLVQPDGAGRLLLPIGAHRFEFEAKGYATRVESLRIVGGEVIDLPIALAVLETAPSSVAVVPAPPSPQDVADDGPKLRYTWVALSSAVLFGGAAFTTGLLSNNEYDALERECNVRNASGLNPCRSDTLDTDRLDRLTLLTNVGLGLTGVSLLSAVVIGYLEWPRSERMSPKVALSPRGANVSVDF